MNSIYPGIVIAIKCWWGEHWGIVAANSGRLTLISNRGLRNCVTEELIEAVIDNSEWHVVELNAILPLEIVIARARSMIGSQYDFWKWNCQDFVHWAHGYKPSSPQREAVVNVLGIVGVGVFLSVAAKGRR